MRTKSQVYWKDGVETIRVGSLGTYSFVPPDIYEKQTYNTYAIPQLFDKVIEDIAKLLNITKSDTMILVLSRGLNALGYHIATDKDGSDIKITQEVKKED